MRKRKKKNHQNCKQPCSGPKPVDGNKLEGGGPEPGDANKLKADAEIARYTKVAAQASVVVAVLTFFTVLVMAYTTYSVEQDAKETKDFQWKLNQGLVFSSCMDKYYQIFRDARDHWKPTDSNTNTQDAFCRQIYGLHYQEYHLCCKQRLIPPHIYVDWLRSLLEDSERNDPTRPKLNIQPYNTPYTDPDFHDFLEKLLVLKHTNIVAISNLVFIEREKDRH